MKLAHPPVAVAFLAAPPIGLPHIDKPLPAGCGYWRHASDGHAFYTTPADHENCTVGAFCAPSVAPNGVIGLALR